MYGNQRIGKQDFKLYRSDNQDPTCLASWRVVLGSLSSLPSWTLPLALSIRNKPDQTHQIRHAVEGHMIDACGTHVPTTNRLILQKTRRQEAGVEAFRRQNIEHRVDGVEGATPVALS